MLHPYPNIFAVPKTSSFSWKKSCFRFWSDLLAVIDIKAYLTQWEINKAQTISITHDYGLIVFRKHMPGGNIQLMSGSPPPPRTPQGCCPSIPHLSISHSGILHFSFSQHHFGYDAMCPPPQTCKPFSLTYSLPTHFQHNMWEAYTNAIKYMLLAQGTHYTPEPEQWSHQ